MGDKTQSRRTHAASRTPRLIDARRLAPLHPLLHALVGRSPDDLFARMAVLQTLAESRSPVFSPRDLAGALPWLTGRTRSALVRALRQGGWLEADPAAGLVLTETGRRAYAALFLLLRSEGGGEHRPTGDAGDEMTAALQRSSLGELASAGREALLPVLRPLPLLSTDAVVQETERLRRH
jgi:hypothetical protein